MDERNTLNCNTLEFISSATEAMRRSTGTTEYRYNRMEEEECDSSDALFSNVFCIKSRSLPA